MKKPLPAHKMKYYATYNKVIKEFVLDQAEKRDNIIYGSQALREQMSPAYITRHPKDWDIHSKNPKRDAHEMARKLNKYYNCNMFYVIHKPRYTPYGTIDVYSVKNSTITPPYTKDMMHTPAIRYSPIKEKREEISQYKALTEVDYTPIQEGEEYETMPDRDIKVRSLSSIYAQRKKIIKQKDYAFRRQKDTSVIKDIERYQKQQEISQALKKGQIPIITFSGKRKFIPKTIGGKK